MIGAVGVTGRGAEGGNGGILWDIGGAYLRCVVAQLRDSNGEGFCGMISGGKRGEW